MGMGAYYQPCPNNADHCLYYDGFCDGVNNCGDNSDEYPEVCQPNGQYCCFLPINPRINFVVVIKLIIIIIIIIIVFVYQTGKR